MALQDVSLFSSVAVSSGIVFLALQAGHWGTFLPDQIISLTLLRALKVNLEFAFKNKF